MEEADMYDLKLTESYVPAQPDGTLLDLSVGGLLRHQVLVHVAIRN